MFKIILVAACAGLFIVPQFAQGDSADSAARMILDKAIAHEDLLERSFSKLVVSYRQSEGGAKLTVSGPAERLRMTNARLRFVVDIKETLRTNGPMAVDPVREEFILTNEGRMAIYMPEKTYSQLDLGKPDSAPAVAAGMIADPTWAGFLDGYVPVGGNGGADILKLAAQSSDLSISTSPQSVGGIEVYTLFSEGGDWRIRLSIAPEDDYCVVKASITRNSLGAVKRMEAFIDNVQLGEVGSERFVWSAHYFGRTDYTDPAKPELETDETAHRLNLRLDPPLDPSDFSLAEVPNGTPVQLIGQALSGIQYVWKDGNAVPYVDSDIVRGIQRDVNQLRPQNGAPIAYTGSGDATDLRTVLFATALGVAAAALALAIGATMILLWNEQRTRP